ncbi:MAG: hypothetical protein ACI8ZO_000914 [Flavobacteriales bacterium]|jgi:hypothetical protein
MAKKTCCRAELVDDLQKNGEDCCPKISPITAAPLRENDSGFVVDIGGNNDQRVHTCFTY